MSICDKITSDIIDFGKQVAVVAQLRRHYCPLTMSPQKLKVRQELHNFI
jgi:hypothetical protein